MSDLDRQLCRILLVLVLGLLALGGVVALSHVSAETSFGLREILMIFAILANGIIGRFSGRADKKEEAKA